MIRILLVSLVVFFTSPLFAMDHGHYSDNEYYNDQEQSQIEVVQRFKFKKGEAKKFRPYRPEPYFKLIKSKVRSLDPATRDEAIKEIDRHIESMSKILGDRKGFPDYIAKHRSSSERRQQNKSRQRTESERGAQGATQQEGGTDTTNDQSSENIDQKKTYQKIKRRIKVV